MLIHLASHGSEDLFAEDVRREHRLGSSSSVSGAVKALVDRVAGILGGSLVLVTTLTKKMAEDLTDYLLEQGLRVRYLHSNIDTIQRIEILQLPAQELIELIQQECTENETIEIDLSGPFIGLVFRF